MSLQYRKISMLYLVQVQACLKDCRELIAAPHYQRNIDGLMERINETMNGADVSSAAESPNEKLWYASWQAANKELDEYRAKARAYREALESVRSELSTPKADDHWCINEINQVIAQYNATPEKK